MKDTLFTKAVDEVLKEDMEAIDAVIKEDIEPLGKVGSPEALLGKKYEDWTPQDLQRMAGVYGEGDDTPLAKLIAKKEYEKLLALEQEV